MASSAAKRLFKEYRALSNDPPEGITAGPVSEDDMFIWEALIQGPEGTPFEGGVYPAELRFPKDYPLAPPKMKFVTEMWHPNGTSARALARSQKEKKRKEGRYGMGEGNRLTIMCSISKRRSMHIHSPRTRRRPNAIRTSLRTLVAHTKRREDPDKRHEHVGGAER
jgi:hypothetical protein